MFTFDQRFAEKMEEAAHICILRDFDLYHALGSPVQLLAFSDQPHAVGHGPMTTCMKLHAGKVFSVRQGQGFFFDQTCRASGKRRG
jgi:hypothetical protein